MYRTVPQRFAVFNQRLIRKIFLGGLAAALAVAIAPAPAFAQVDDNKIFELDGNPTAGTVLDWSSALGAFSGTDVPVTEDPNTSIFTTGGSKDEQDISNWRHKDGSVPPKDDMLNAAAKVMTLSGGPAIVFAADRYSNNGDAQIGFWFLQQQINLASDGTFGPAMHQDGDLLALANFSNGGTVASVEVYEWLAGAPVLISNAATAGKCDPAMTHTLACVITNASTTAIPTSWPFSPKAGSANTYPQQSFFEGAIDLGSLFPGGIPCFSSFLVETRSSTSITATLKDFIGGGFESCGISVTKNCTGAVLQPDGQSVKFSFGGEVTNDGSGTVYDVIVRDSALPGEDIVVAASLAGGLSAPWSAEKIVNGLSLPNTATAYAAGSPGGDQDIESEDVTQLCEAQAEGLISISKMCDPGTSLVQQGSVVVVQVGVSGQVCNEGPVALQNIILANDPTADITFTSVTLAPKDETGSCAPWSATYTPTEISDGDGSGPGRYFFDDTIKVTAAKTVFGESLPANELCEGGAVACKFASCPICPEGFCPVP